MMNTWQALLLLISVPILILSILSFLGQLIRLLPYVFLTVFGFGGIALIVHGKAHDTLLGTIELLIGSLLTLISAINLYLIISNHHHDREVLQSRRPFMPIRNIVLDKIEKPRFGNPNTIRPNSKQNVPNKKAHTEISKLAPSSVKPSRHSSQF